MLNMSDFNAFAVTESAPEGPNSACEAELAPDPFYRLIARASDDGLLTPQDLRELGESRTPYNPLARKLKVNPSLLRALDRELAKMTSERWARLQPAIVSHASQVVGQNSARAESREETAAILKLKELKAFRAEPYIGGYQFNRPAPEFYDQRWLQRGDETLLVLRSSGKSGEKFSAPGLNVVNLFGEEAFRLNDSEYVTSEEGSIVDPWTWSRIGRGGAAEDSGLIQIANKGMFVLHEKLSDDYDYNLTVRKLGSWRWWSRFKNRFSLPTTSLAVAAIGGEDDGYILIRQSRGNQLSLVHFNGNKLTPVTDIKIADAQNLFYEFKRDKTGRVYLLASPGSQAGWLFSQLMVIDKFRVSVSETFDPKDTRARSVRFWRDLDGRLSLFGFQNSKIMLRFLDQNGKEDLVVAEAPPQLKLLIQPFQFQGAYHVFGLTDSNRLVAVNLKTSAIAAEFSGDFPVDLDRWSLHQSPDGQVYALVRFADDFARLFSLVSKVESR